MGGYTHTLTREVQVVERFVVRPLYPPNSFMAREASEQVGAMNALPELPVWQQEHDAYADAVNAGLVMLANAPGLDGFTIDKLFRKVQHIDGVLLANGTVS